MQALRRFLKRDESCGGKHPRLAHSATQQLARNPSFIDKIARAHQHRADRRAESFREAEHHRIEFLCDLVDGFSQRGCGIENSRAVQMHGQAGGVGAVADVVGNRGRIDRAAVHVVRVFEFDQSCLRAVIDVRADQRLDQIPGKRAVFGRDRVGHAAGDRAHGGHFVEINMRLRFADNFRAGARPGLDCREIRHRARREIEGGFAAEDFGGAGLEAVDRRIFSVDIIPHLGFGHRASHGGRRARDRVAAKIDHRLRRGGCGHDFDIINA